MKGLHIENTLLARILNSVVKGWTKSYEIQEATERDTYTAKQIWSRRHPHQSILFFPFLSGSLPWWLSLPFSVVWARAHPHSTSVSLPACRPTLWGMGSACGYYKTLGRHMCLPAPAITLDQLKWRLILYAKLPKILNIVLGNTLFLKMFLLGFQL